MCRLVRTACKHVHLNTYVPERQGWGRLGGGTICVLQMCNNTYTVQTSVDLEFRDKLKKERKKTIMSDILSFLITCPLALAELSLYLRKMSLFSPCCS